jgi:hypothetical protein
MIVPYAARLLGVSVLNMALADHDGLIMAHGIS